MDYILSRSWINIDILVSIDVSWTVNFFSQIIGKINKQKTYHYCETVEPWIITILLSYYGSVRR